MTKLIAIIATLASGTLFTMCQGGPVPAGCCKPGDQLNVVMTEHRYPQWVTECDNMGGEPIAYLDNGKQIFVCEAVDF